jgi:RimJ/RimL family protein N-acetyltransferase
MVMIKLRNYLDSDAQEILKWIKDEKALRLWSADRYETYPIKPEDITNNYKECMESAAFYPMTLVDKDKIIGHLILRKPNPDENKIRLGFIIVDNTMRKKGYGRLLISEAIKYAKDMLKASEINLGVFANNENAYSCYKSIGFEEVGREENALQFENETWDCVEMILLEK